MAGRTQETSMLDKFKNKAVAVISSRHVAGPDLKDALLIRDWAETRDVGTVISPWIGSLDSPRQVLQLYSDAISAVQPNHLGSHVAIKLSALGYDYGLFEELLGIARSKKVKLQIDSLEHESAAKTHALIEKASATYRNIGCTLPSRWLRSASDAERAAELRIHARVVKGQWHDPTSPKIDPRANFLTIVSKLAKRGADVSIGTHDYPLADKALEILAESDARFELAQFFSLPLNGFDLSRKYKCPYLIYIAYRSPYMPYNWHFFLSRPSMMAWLIRDFTIPRPRPWNSHGREPFGYVPLNIAKDVHIKS